MRQYAATLSKNVNFCVDVLLTGLAFYAAFHIKLALPGNYGGLAEDINYPFVALLIVMIAGLCFHTFQLYQPGRHLYPIRILFSIVKAVAMTLVLSQAVLFFLHVTDISRLLLFLHATIVILLLFLVRLVWMQMFRFGLVQNRQQKDILIIGSYARAKNLIRHLRMGKDYNYRILGCVDGDETVGQRVAEDVSVIASLKDYPKVLRDLAVDEIVFARPLRSVENATDLISYAEQLGITVRILPDWQLFELGYEPEIASIAINDFAGLPTLALTSVPRQALQLTFKEILDRSIALLGLIALAPLFGVIALAIKRTSPGPVFFKQQRSGLNGRPIEIYKFRSMVANAEELRKTLEDQNEEDGPAFKMANDPRLTSIGHLLRKTSLDELPQLINVLKGEMSLVGPRPPLPSEVEQYNVWQLRRLSVKPGITCIWQVSGRNTVTFERWMNMDLEYIDNWSLWLDFKLLLKTIPAVLFGTGR